MNIPTRDTVLRVDQILFEICNERIQLHVDHFLSAVSNLVMSQSLARFKNLHAITIAKGEGCFLTK